MFNSTLDWFLYGTPQQKELGEKMEKMFNEFANEKYPSSICILRFFRINVERNTVTMHFIRKADDGILDYESDSVELPL